MGYNSAFCGNCRFYVLAWSPRAAFALGQGGAARCGCVVDDGPIPRVCWCPAWQPCLWGAVVDTISAHERAEALRLKCGL